MLVIFCTKISVIFILDKNVNTFLLDQNVSKLSLLNQNVSNFLLDVNVSNYYNFDSKK